MCCSAVNDGSCSPWVMCSSSVVRGNQIRDKYILCLINTKTIINKHKCLLNNQSTWSPIICRYQLKKLTSNTLSSLVITEGILILK